MHPIHRSLLVLGLVIAQFSNAADVTLPELTTAEDTPILLHPIPLQGTGATNPTVVLSVPSQQSLLFPQGSILVSRTGTNWALSVFPAPDKSGSTLLTLDLLEGTPPALAGTIRVPIRVNPVNDPPEIKPIPDQRWFVNAPIPRVPISTTDAELEPRSIGIEIVSSTFIPALSLRIQSVNSEAGSGTLTSSVQGNATTPGVLTARVWATDRSGASNSTTFNAIIEPAWLASPSSQSSSFGIPAVPISLVDINRDGRPDLHAHSVPQLIPPVSILPTNSVAYRPQINNVNLNATTLGEWGDLDGDGRLDLLQPATPSQVVVWRSGIGTPRESFSAITNLVPTNVRSRVAIGDLDGDGDQDALLSTPGPVTLRNTFLLRNDGAGHLTHLPCGLSSHGGPVSLADIDGDGDLDALILDRESTDAATGTLSLHLNDGFGTFTQSPASLPQGPFTAAGWIDFDSDGVPEIWTQRTTGTQIQRLELHKPLSWTFPTLWGIEGTNAAVFRGQSVPPIWADFDNDGLLDVLTPSSAGAIHGWFVHRQGPGGSLRAATLLPGIPSSASIAAADVDRNGTIDLVFPQGQQSRVFTNTLPFLNLPPTTPSGLRSDRLGPGVFRLTWNRSSDLNQSAPLTYNVRAGRFPGTSDLVPSMALASGVRLLRAPGNAGARLEMILRTADKEVESIHWTVQAIDLNGVGSAFAQEANIPAAGSGVPPTLVNPAEVTCTEDSIASFSVQVADNLTQANLIEITATIDDPSLAFVWVPVKPGLDGQARVSISSRPDQNGSSLIKLVARDLAGLAVTNRIRLTVTPVNDPPELTTPALPLVQFIGELAPSIELLVSDPDSALSALNLQVLTDNEALCPQASLRIESVEPNRIRIRRLNAPQSAGLVNLRVSVIDTDLQTTSVSLPVEIVPRLLSAPEVIASGPAYNPQLADFDGDGDLDLAYVDPDAQIQLRRNEGNLGWSSLPTPNSSPGNSFRWSDLNGDQRPDLVVRASQNQIFAVTNLGGIWTRSEPISSPSMFSVEWADLDNDGRPDLIGLSQSESGDTLLINLTLGGPRTLLATARNFARIQPGDWNADGVSDVLGLTAEGWRWIHPGAPDGSWIDDPLPWPWTNSDLAQVGDYDRNGQPDIYLGSSSLVGVAAPPRGGITGNLELGRPNFSPIDLDGGGNGFLAALPNGEPLYWIRPASLGTPRSLPITQAGVQSRPVIGDINGDGAIDVVAFVRTGAIDQPSTQLEWYRNLRRPGPIPSAPIPLAPRFGPAGPLLRWEPAPDHASNGCTFHVRIGSAPGLSDVLNTGARPDGSRYIALGPDTLPTRQRAIGGLKPGYTYYWAVQAVSQDGRGSPFSAEGSFVAGTSSLVLTGPTVVEATLSESYATVLLGDRLPAGIQFEPVANPGFILLDRPVTATFDHGSYRLQFPLRPSFAGTASINLHATDPAGNTAIHHFDIARTPVAPNTHSIYRVLALPAADGSALIDVSPVLASGALHLQSIETPPSGELQPEGTHFRWIPSPNRATNPIDVVTLRYQDGAGRSVAARFSIPANPTVLRVVPRPGGRTDVILTLPPFSRGRIKTSTDLTQWILLQPYQMNEDGYLALEGLLSTDSSHRFFRIIPE